MYMTCIIIYFREFHSEVANKKSMSTDNEVDDRTVLAASDSL